MLPTFRRPPCSGFLTSGCVGSAFFTLVKTYWEKLKDPRWQKKRLEIMQRDDFSCQVCSSKDNTLNVHHRLYRKGKSPWEYDDSDLVTLCEKCHGEVTKQNQEISEWLAGPSPIHSAIHGMYQFHNDGEFEGEFIADTLQYTSFVQSCLREENLSSLEDKITKLDGFSMRIIDSLSRIKSQLQQKRVRHPDYIPIWKRTK